jgi:hypothetical protein
MQHQITQNAEFRRAEMDGLAGAPHPVRGGIELYVRVLQHIR